MNRLFSSVSRSAVLRAFPTRTVKRIDLAHFRVAHSEAPEELVRALTTTGGRYNLRFPDYRRPDDRGTQSQALFATLRSRLAREAQAAHRETGLWMLWLAYPLLYVPHPAAEHNEFLLAPIFLWPIAIEDRALPEGELVLSRGNGAPRFNRIAWQWIRRNLQFDPPEPTGADALALGDFSELDRLVRYCCSGFRPSIDAALRPQVEPIPTRDDLRSEPNSRLLDAGIVGLLQWENMELLADLEKLHDSDVLTGPAGDFLRERERSPMPRLEVPKEADRYLVTGTDFSQERAV